MKWWENKCFWNFSFDLRQWEKTWKAFFNYLKWKLTTSTRMSPFNDDPFQVIWRIKYLNLLSHLSPHIIVFDGNSPSTKVVNIKNELGQFLKQLILRMTTFVHKGGFINITCHLFSYPFRSSEQEAYISVQQGNLKDFPNFLKEFVVQGTKALSVWWLSTILDKHFITPPKNFSFPFKAFMF